MKAKAKGVIKIKQTLNTDKDTKTDKKWGGEICQPQYTKVNFKIQDL